MPARSGASSSSMNTTSSFGSSWLDGSPSRQSPNRSGVRSHRGSPMHRASPGRDLYDSPTRQMLIDYNLMLSRSDQAFNEKLDKASMARAKVHAEQLAKAAQDHAMVQRGAQLEVQRILLEQELERLRREEAQQREVERLAQERAAQEEEQHQRLIEAKQREAQEAQQAAERQRQVLETDARIKAQKEQEDAARRQKDEAQRQQQAAAAAAQEKLQQGLPSQPKAEAQPTVVKGASPATSNPSATFTQVEESHQKYIDLHARMKQFRKEFEAKHKVKGNPLKEVVGETRRNMRKRLGQVTIERKDSSAAIAALRTEVFARALSTPGPTVDIRSYVVGHKLPPLANEQDAQFPALLLYAFVCFEKSIINQWSQEAAGEEGRIIAELGLIAASLYADTSYMFKNVVPLTDTILAKLHRRCPMLFGIRGDSRTQAGLARLGLDRIGTNDAALDAYGQRMRGLGAGFAAMSLRVFTGKTPAIPAEAYWRALVAVCNTPAEDLHAAHFMLLQGLLKEYAKKFLAFYGGAGEALMRRAVRELPAQVPQDRQAVVQAAALVRVLPDTWRVRQGVNVRW